MSSFYVKHERVITELSDEQVTKQEHKAECDINNILKQFQMTGIITHIQSQEPMFADLPDAMDYQEAITIATRAEEAFDALPSKVRDHFNNDPQRFLAAFEDPAQADKLIELGLRSPPPPPEARTPQPPKSEATPAQAPSQATTPAKAGE